MRRNKWTLLVLMLTAVCLSSGCWDAKDINDKTLVTFVITDRQEEELVFYSEVPNLETGMQQQGAGGTVKFSIMSSRGRTYAEARRHMDAKMDKPVFLGTVRTLVITDRLAKYNMEEYMNRMQNMADYRKTLKVVTTHEKPGDLLSVQPENNVSIGKSVEDTIDSLLDAGKIVDLFRVGTCSNF